MNLNMLDTMDNAVTIFGISFFIIIMGFFMFNFGNQMATIPAFQSGAGAIGVDMVNSYSSWMDWVPLAIYIIMLIGSVYFARRSQDLGISVLFSYFLIGIVTIIVVVLGFILNTLVTGAALAAYVSEIPIISFYSEYSLIFGLIYAFVVLVALHGGANE